METVTVSTDFQVEIPVAARESLGLRPGQQFQVLLYNGRLDLIPTRPLLEWRGFLRGIDTKIEREDDRV